VEAYLRLVEYSSDWFEKLLPAARSRGPLFCLQYRSFVDYYYTTHPEWCRLYLAVGKDDAIIGTQGAELMRFQCNQDEKILFFPRDYFSTQPGVGTYLFMKWMQVSSSRGIAFGGTEQFHQIIRALGWTYFNDIQIYYMNEPYHCHLTDGLIRRGAKWFLNQVYLKKLSEFAVRLPEWVRTEITVQEEQSFTEDMLPQHSPFSFRFAPTAEYLNWRYNTELPFIWYRLFRILHREKPDGYVVIGDFPERLIVAQCDSDDTVALSYGILLSILEAGRNDEKPRTVMLSSSHLLMRGIFEEFGFRAWYHPRPFAIGGLRVGVDIPMETSNWLVNFDWGNNGLRAPFVDRASRRALRPAVSGNR